MASPSLAARPEIEKLDTGLDAEKRKKLASNLGEVLSDTYVLLVKTHVYHWNVVGPLFVPLHELTEEHYKDLFEATDEIAERIRALGHVTPLSFSALENKTALHEETTARSAEGLVEQLVDDHEAMVRRIRKVTAEAADCEDFVTHDLLNARLAFHEKAIWMLRAIIA